MSRHAFTFLGTFVLGALLALVARAALYAPDARHEAALASGGNYAPMVSNAAASDATHASSAHGAQRTPANSDAATQPADPSTAASSDEHSGHASAPAKSANEPANASAASNKPVNTVCAICGMEVDPDLPTATYQGKTIGFGCRACPAKFKANPDKYGPAYLRNEVIDD